jgi:hypothetical protein
LGKINGVAELRYELPSPPAPLPRERGAFNSCPLSLGERARVRVNLAIHTRIQQSQIKNTQIIIEQMFQP